MSSKKSTRIMAGVSNKVTTKTKKNMTTSTKLSNKNISKLSRESTMDSITSAASNDFTKQHELTNDTLKNLSSSLKMHIYNPAEIQTDLDQDIYILPANRRRTSDVMSEYEYTRVKSERAQQIQNGAQIFVDHDPMMDEIEIAALEIKTKNCPMSIIRMLNAKVGEIWEVNEMELPFM